MYLPRVGVVRGGTSDEYDVSLKTGGAVLASLAERGYPFRDILITKDGTWHSDGAPTTPGRVAQTVDVVWNALHGHFGEDGKIQQIFETHRIPYTGSSSFVSAMGLHKGHARVLLHEAGMHIPRGTTVFRDERPHAAAQRVLALFHPPYIVKPIAGGSSIGVAIAESTSDLMVALEKIHHTHGTALVEERLAGDEVIVGAVASRDGTWNILRPFKVAVSEHLGFFTYQEKSSTASFTLIEDTAEGERVASLMRQALHALGARHYATADFIATPRGVYILEVNTQPGLAAHGAFSRMLAACDTTFDDFVAHTIELALAEK
ncbi:MAG: D-alanine--D-alanine ligase family protein [Minisyncoccota bacterium]